MKSLLNGRMLVVTRALPVESGGTMIVLRRLLENFSSNDVVVLGRTPYQPRILKSDKPLHYPNYEIPTPQIKGFRLWRLLSIIPGFFQGLYLIHKYKVKVILGVYPDEGSLLLSWLLSRATKRSLFSYFCDLYMENRKFSFERKLSQRLQPLVFRDSARVIVANAGMKSFYDKYYQVDSLLMPTAINGNIPGSFRLPPVKDVFIIGYSGSVVPDRLDPMQALIRAVGGNKRYEIRVFSPQSEEYLKSVNIWASNVKTKFCAAQDELITELSGCHLLYLPLTFKTNNNSEHQLATCFGIKCYEYFQSCRPVLVHCPPHYFTSMFFTTQDCGISIDTLDVDKIKQSLEDIQDNYEIKAKNLVDNALIVARQFVGSDLADRFSNEVNTLVERNPHQ